MINGRFRGLVFVLIVASPRISAEPAWMSFTNSVVQDIQGNAYFVGSVTSDIVPVTAGAFQTRFNGGICGSMFVGNVPQPAPCQHGFAVKVSVDGGTIIYATYLEGNANDQAIPVGVDSSGDLFVLVNTTSTNFPQTSSLGL